MADASLVAQQMMAQFPEVKFTWAKEVAYEHFEDARCGSSGAETAGRREAVEA